MYYLDEDIIITIYPSGATKDLVCPYTVYRKENGKDVTIFNGNVFIGKGTSAVYFQVNDIVGSFRWDTTDTDNPNYRSIFDIPVKADKSIIGLVDQYKITVKAESYTVSSPYFQVANIYRYPFQKTSLTTQLADDMANMLYGSYNKGKGMVYPPRLPFIESENFPFTTVIYNFTPFDTEYSCYYSITNTENWGNEVKKGNTKINPYDDSSVQYVRDTTANMFNNIVPKADASVGTFGIVNAYQTKVQCLDTGDGDFTYAGDEDFQKKGSYYMAGWTTNYNLTSIKVGYTLDNQYTITPTAGKAVTFSQDITIGDIPTSGGDLQGISIACSLDDSSSTTFVLWFYIDYTKTTLQKGDTVTLSFAYYVDNTNQFIRIGNCHIQKYTLATRSVYQMAVVDFCPKDYYVIWQDRYGGLQSQPFSKTLTYSEDITHREIVSYNGYRSFGNSDIQPKWHLNTDWIDEKYYPIYESILISPYVRLYDTKEDKFYEILITDSSYTEKTFKNQQRQMFNFSIEAELAKTQSLLY